MRTNTGKNELFQKLKSRITHKMRKSLKKMNFFRFMSSKFEIKNYPPR